MTVSGPGRLPGRTLWYVGSTRTWSAPSKTSTWSVMTRFEPWSIPMASTSDWFVRLIRLDGQRTRKLMGWSFW